MSALKSNNRFSFLDEESANIEPIKNPPKEREREYDNKPKYSTSYNQFKNYNSVSIPPVKKDFEMDENMFPDLAKPVKINLNVNSKSFASLLEKKETNEEITEEDEVVIPPGWTYYKCTKLKNELFGDKCSKVTTQIQKTFIEKNYETEKQTNKVELNEAEKIIEALSLLHEKRTNEYKELWGELEWERMFICPNHDYEYFDKLDEAYEIEQSNLNEKYYNADADDDYYYY